MSLRSLKGSSMTIAATFAVIILLITILSQSWVEASHFQFGTYEWERTPDNNGFKLSTTQAWRYGAYFTIDNNNPISPYVTGTTTYKTAGVGSLYVGPLSSATQFSSSTSTNLVLTLSSAYRDPISMYANEGWFFGQSPQLLVSSTGPYSSIWAGVDKTYATYYNLCCRIGELLDNNNDDTSQVTGWIIPNKRRYSISVTGFPREFVIRFREMSVADPSKGIAAYQIKASNRDNNALPLDLTMSPTSAAIGGTLLTYANPGRNTQAQSSTAMGTNILQISNNILVWTPTNVASRISPWTDKQSCLASKTYCPYALSVTINDNQLGLTGFQKVATQLDFLIIVMPPCDTANPVSCPPVFIGDAGALNSVATIPNLFGFTVKVDTTYVIGSNTGTKTLLPLEYTPPPPGVLVWWSFSDGNRVITAKVYHDAEVDGPNSAVICFHGTTAAGMTTVGNFCPVFTVIKPNYMFLTGTLRPFTPDASTNCIDRSATGCATPPTVTSLNPTTLKPVGTAVANGVPVSAFDSWWTSSTGAKLYTITMVSYFNPALDNSMTAPTDGTQGTYMDNRRRVYSFRRPYWNPADSADAYYTYELHTSFDVLNTQTDTLRSVKFGVTGGELWVFMNKKLAFNLSGNAAGTSSTAIDTGDGLVAISQTKTWSDLLTLIDPTANKASTDPATYDIDIFYTHRNGDRANSGFVMEFGSTSRCSAITVLSKGTNSKLIQQSVIFDYVDNYASLVPASITTQQNWDLAKWTVNYGTIISPTSSTKAMQLLSTSQTATASVAFYSDAMLKVLNGFEAKFSFTMTSPAAGLAFVMQSQAPTAKGGEGQGLGYHGIRKAIAIEFDCTPDAGYDGSTYNYQHISVHKSSSVEPYAISAVEATDSWPLGSTPIGNLPNLPFTFNNGTQHDIRIEFVPTSAAYWMYIYVNQNLKPLYTTSFSRAELDLWYPDGAYMGFTTTNYGGSTGGQVVIRNFKTTVIPPLASKSYYSVSPAQTQAGSKLTAEVQLADACGAELLIRGQSDRFTSKLMHRDSKKPFVAGENQVYDIVDPVVTDIGGGKYRFEALVTRAGEYQLYIFYREVDQAVGQGQPIGEAALTFTGAPYEATNPTPKFMAGNNEPFKKATVVAGKQSSTASYYVYSPVAPTLNNAAATTLKTDPADPDPTVVANQAISCVITNADASSKTVAFYNVATTTQYNKFKTLVANGQVGICVIRSVLAASFGQQVSVAASVFADSDIKATTPALTSASFNTFDLAKDLSATWMYTPGSGHKMVWSSVERVMNVFTSGTAKFYTESWSINRAGPASTGRGMILLHPSAMRVDPSPTATSQFYVYAKDKYFNALATGLSSEITFAFSPILPTSQVVTNPPFATCPFTATTVGEFDLSVYSQDGSGEQLGGASGKLIVLAGPAHYSTSLQTGLTVGGAVDTDMSFTLTLKDQAGNLIQSPSLDNLDRVYIEWVSTTDGTIKQSYKLQLSDYDDVRDVFVVKYRPTFAGTFLIKININPVTPCSIVGTQATTPIPTAQQVCDPAYEMTQSKGLSVAILAGPAHVNSLATQIHDDDSNIKFDTAFNAGQVYLFNVQTKDSYGNLRVVAIDGTKQIYLQLGQNGNLLTDLSSSIVAEQSSLYTSPNAYLTGQNVGSGIYRFTIVFKKAGQYDLQFGLLDSVPTPQAAAPLIKAILSTGVSGDAKQAITVNAGPISAASIVRAWCPTPLASLDYPLYSADQSGSLCSSPPEYRINKEVYFAIQPIDEWSNKLAVDFSQQAANCAANNAQCVSSFITVAWETVTDIYQGKSIWSIVGQKVISADEVYYIAKFEPGDVSGLYKLSPSMKASNAALTKPAGLTNAWDFNVAPTITGFDTKLAPTINWPSILGYRDEADAVQVTFTDIDWKNNKRIAGSAATSVPELTFYMLQERATSSGGTECYDVAPAGKPCAADPSRPSYSCLMKPTSSETSFSLAVSGGKIRNGNTDVDCPVLDVAAKACPIAACRIAKTIETTDNGKTGIYVGGISHGTNAVGIARNFDANNINQKDTSGADIFSYIDLSALLYPSLSNTIRAGDSFTLYLFDQVTTSINGSYQSAGSLNQLALRLVTNTAANSKWSGVTIDKGVNVRTCSQLASAISSKICTSTLGRQPTTALIVVTITGIKTAVEATNNQFSIVYINQSEVLRQFGIRIGPAVMSPTRSLVIRQQSQTTTAGIGWTTQFTPYDENGNAINTVVDWSVSNNGSAKLLQSNGSILTPYTTTAKVTCAFTAPANVGVVTCTVSDGFIVTAGTSAYYLGFTTATTPPTTWPTTSYINNALQVIIILAGPADLSNTLTSFGLSQISFASSFNNPVNANEQFDFYLSAFDKYNNPAKIDTADRSVSIVLTGNDAQWPVSPLPTVTPVGSLWQWTLVSSTNSATIYKISIESLKNVSRYGFKIAVRQPNPNTSITTPVTSVDRLIKVRSGVVTATTNSVTATGNVGRLYPLANTAMTTPLTAADMTLTVDSVFKYRFKLVDDTGLPFTYIISPNGSISPSGGKPYDDVPSLIVTLSAIPNGATNPITVPVTVLSDLDTRGIPRPGIFTIATGDLVILGAYTLIIQTVNQAGTTTAIQYAFTVKAGLPSIDNTRITQMPSFPSGALRTIKFRLYDRLQNPISDDYLTGLTPSPAGTGYAHFLQNKLNKVYPTIHVGQPVCADVHTQPNTSQLTYALPFARPVDYPDFKVTIGASVDNNDGQGREFSIDITPAPSGVYTFNLTYVGANSLVVPASYYGCTNLIPLSFRVTTGPPDAATSYYTITPLDSVTQRPTAWGPLGENVLYAGQDYSVDLNLLDADRQVSVDPVEAYIFYAPGETFDPNVSMFYDPNGSANNNVLSASGEDLTAVFGYSFQTFKFRPKVAKAGYQFSIWIHEDQQDQSGTKTWKRVTGYNVTPGQNNKPSAQAVTVLHGTPAQVKISDVKGIVSSGASTPIIAGAETTFIAEALDAWNNPITTNTLSKLSVIITRDATTFVDAQGKATNAVVPIQGLSYELPPSQISTNANTGISTIVYTPSWEGTFTIQVIMTSQNGLTFYASSQAPPVGSTDKLTVVHATCAGQYYATHSTMTSSTSYPSVVCQSTGNCVTSITSCPALDQLSCKVGEYINTATAKCETLDSNPSFTATMKKCTDTLWVPIAVDCPITATSPSPCPAGTTQCAKAPSQCRAVASQCPSTPSCAPGQFVCPNGLQCASSLDNCPSIPEAVYTTCNAAGRVVCPNGSCMASITDCPTTPTCPNTTDVYCLTDGSCRTSAAKCPVTPVGQVETPATCIAQFNSPTAVLCPGSTTLCASSLANCPSSITCPVGSALCAADNTCQTGTCPASTATTPSGLLPDASVASCAATEFRCSDGTCAQNLLLCSASPTCPASAPVLCSDRSCKTTLALCTQPTQCSANSLLTCPATGQCVTDLKYCSPTKTCVSDIPVLCSTGECVVSIDKCPTVSECQPNLPYRCSSGNCRASIDDCPSVIGCPTTTPLRCADNSCAVASEMCNDVKEIVDLTTGVITVDTSSTQCPSGLTNCPTGECTANILTCPTHTTCPTGSKRCPDGTCREDCSTVQPADCISRNMITCPISGSGYTCATKLSDCPQGITCPLTKPVKCLDATCAATAFDCPALPTGLTPPAEKTPCADGSWVIGSNSDCPTAVTCPPNTPIKCYDQSCVATVNECPVAVPCEEETSSAASTKPYRCTSGACVAAPWDCGPVLDGGSICPTATPIKCATYQGSTTCVDNITKCGTYLDSTGTNPSNPTPEATNPYTSPCAPGYTYCRDKSCQESPSFCPVFSCPPSFPTLCSDGSCALATAQCPNQTTGCPWDLPVRCPGVGKCVDKLASCPASTCSTQGLQSCSDGTCRESCATVTANGCSVTEFRCNDGTCVSESAKCSSQGNDGYANSCPPGTPFRCANGYCTEKSSQCISLPSAEYCLDSKKPVLCADGSCALSTDACPLVKPCPSSEYVRCDDGTCKLTGSLCPNYNSCPSGTIRCKQADYPNFTILDGMCAKPGQCPTSNGCPIGGGGVAQYRCPQNGRCVAAALKDSLCTAALPTTNGCPSDKATKCWNGDCADGVGKCPPANGCTVDKPTRCPNGDCIATSATCSATQLKACDTTTMTLCADGSCVSSQEKCSTTFGCPVTAPVRCYDGSCRKYPAQYRSAVYGLTNELINSLTCAPVLSCPSTSYSMCADGSCVLSTALCPSSNYPCAANEVQCFGTGTCRPSNSLCGFDQVFDSTGNPVLDGDGNPTWKPSASKPPTCPSGSAILCSSGQCVADVTLCNTDSDPSTTTITGSPTASKPDVEKEFQVQCFDGTWRNTYAECRQFSQAVSTADSTAACVDYCANGSCLLAGQDPSIVCGLVDRCQYGYTRCFDGQCLKSCDDVAVPKTICDETNIIRAPGVAADATVDLLDYVVNIDGQCRHRLYSLQYNGCGMHDKQRYHCPNRECGSGAADCFVIDTITDVDAYAKTELGESVYTLRREREEALIKSGVKVPSVDDVTDALPLKQKVKQPTLSLLNIPNSIIAMFVEENRIESFDQVMTAQQASPGDDDSPSGGGETDPDAVFKSCSVGCASLRNVISTSVLYSPLLSSQEYNIAPLSAGFSMKLFSGLEVKAGEDSSINVHRVGNNVHARSMNKVTWSRVDEFKSQSLTSPQTVLSPVFSCSVGAGIVEPFQIGIQLTSLIDRIASPQPRDTCLARLRRFPDHNYSSWECLFTDVERASGEVRFSTRQSTTQPLRQVVGSIYQCYDDDLSVIAPTTDSTTDPASMTMLQDDSAQDVKHPAVYAFIHAPVATDQVFLPSKDNFWKNNIIWLLFVIIGAVLLVFLIIYAVLRLSRYKAKTKQVKKELENTEKEVQDMEQFGGEKRRDQEVGYVANPLAVSLEQQQALAEQTDEQKIANKKALLTAQQMDSAERKEVIDTLEGDNEAALAALEALRKRAGGKA